jgi:RNA polymerase sigma factor (sigma-70 family)
VAGRSPKVSCRILRRSVSHLARRRCSTDVDVVAHGVSASAAALSSDGHGAAARRAERRDGVAVSTPQVQGAVRADLEQVFRCVYPRVVAVAARVLGSRDEAEDVAQEVFLAFGRSSVPAGQALGWLSAAAAHTALNHLRSGRRRAFREEAAGEGHAVSPDVADAVVALDERRRVRAALARLPRRHAVALVLRHSGLSYAEVAAALDLSPGSVGTTVRRAESALRKELNRHASSD